MRNSLFETFIAIVGGVIFAFAVACLASPVGLVTGGVSGVGIVLKELTGGKLPIFVTSLVLNIPLFIICTVQRGVRFIAKSLVAFLTLTVALSVFENMPPPIDFEGDLVMSTLSYGILSGVGLGLVLRVGATSGGTDMLAAIIKRKKPSTPISALIAIIDAVIILLGTFVFGVRLSLYSIVALFISAKVIDLTLSGLGVAKTVFIISDECEEIAQRISTELERGVTGIDAVGMYTGKKRKMLFAVVSSREVATLRKIVGECDGRAFVTVSNAKQVLGEGFDQIFVSRDSFS